MSSKEKGKEKKEIFIVRENPLISRDLLDTGRQRLMVLSFFILIQAFKVYDFIILQNGGSESKLETPQMINSLFLVTFKDNKMNFLFKYLILDTLFIWTVPILNLPFLNFNRVVSTIQVIFMVLLNLSLANEVNLPLLSSLIAFASKLMNINQKETTLLGDIINKNQAFDHTQYFKGRKTIKFLPDSLVELNPFNNQWCLDSTTPIQVPIKFNTSSNSLDFLQLKYINPEDNTVDLYNFTSKNLGKMVKTGRKNYFNEIQGQDNIFYVDLPLATAGLYQINQVIDDKSLNLKIKNTPLLVPQCPTAKFISTNPNISEKCLNDHVKDEDLLINVVGLPPLTVEYTEEFNGKILSSPKKSIAPTGFHSPLESSTSFSRKDVQELSSWANLRSVNLPILKDEKLTKSGEYIYSIKSIKDALGNSIVYDEPSLDNNLLFRISSHDIPHAKLVDSYPARPLLEGNPKRLNIQLSGIACQKCDAPYKATFDHYDQERNHIKSFDQTFDFGSSRDLSLLVSEPGIYQLSNFASNYCSSSELSEVTVPFVSKPDIDISAESIIDGCVGTTGFTFSFNVTGGTPPFRLEYKIHRLKNGRPTSIPQIKAIEAKSHFFEHDFKPVYEGNYSVEFTKIRDQYYEEKFEAGKFKFVTYFKQKPKVLVATDSYDICNGDSQVLPLKFEGTPPFSLSYNLLQGDKIIQTFNEEEINSNELNIVTPNFGDGGHFQIQLIEGKDSSSCNVDFEKKLVNMNVRQYVTEASFTHPQKVTIVQGSYDTIPITFKNANSKLVNFKYQIENPDGSTDIYAVDNFRVGDKLKVEKSGIYSLLEVQDQGCPGTVTSNHIQVDYIKKPTIELLTESVPPVCVGKHQQFQFKLNGKAPFGIDYSIKHPDQHLENRFVEVQDSQYVLDVVSETSGEYIYSINGVSDSHYTSDILSSLQRKNLYSFDKIVVKHSIYTTPSAFFSNSSSSKASNSHQNRHIQMCYTNLNDENSLEPLPIRLSGELPFNVKMRISSKEQNFEKTFKLNDIGQDIIDSYDIYKLFKLNIGTYTVSLLEIEDANGCSNKNLEEQSNKVILKINDVPKIKRHINKFVENNKIDISKFTSHKTNKNEKYDDYYCVGDHIYFQLEGTPPFNVGYSFNDESHHISNLNTANFKRLVTKPGELIIDTLSDFSAKNCLVDFKKLKERIKIYDLPSVEISHGDSIEEDIHAGEKAEILFTFKGVPPFKLTYTRTIEGNTLDRKAGKKYRDRFVETQVVENIQGYEYSIWTSLDGTYEAVGVEDSRCRVHSYV